MVREEDRPLLGRVADALARPLWDRLGWDPRPGEDDEPRLTRAAALWIAGTVARDPAVLAEAEARLARYLADPGTLDPTLATALVRVGARVGDEKRFVAYQDRLLRSSTPEDRDRYLAALAEFPGIDPARRLLEMTLTDAVRGQDAWKPFRPLLSNPAVQGHAWAFVKAHWPALRAKTGSVGAGRIIQATRALWREEWRADVASFFTDPANRVDSAAKALDQTLEFLRLGLEFKAAQEEPLARWLRAGRF